MNAPLPYRDPAKYLHHAREDHARCLGLAAWYRELHRRGEPGSRERHAWALGHARMQRTRISGLLSAPAGLSRASPS